MTMSRVYVIHVFNAYSKIQIHINTQGLSLRKCLEPINIVLLFYDTKETLE